MRRGAEIIYVATAMLREGRKEKRDGDSTFFGGCYLFFLINSIYMTDLGRILKAFRGFGIPNLSFGA